MCGGIICDAYEWVFKVGAEPLGQAFIGSIAGAFGGAWAILMLQRRKEAWQELAFFNFAIVAFSSHVGNLINLRSQVTSPFRDEVTKLRTLAHLSEKRRNAGEEIEPVDFSFHLSSQYVHETQPDFLLAIEQLGKYADKAPKLISWTAQAKQAIGTTFGQVEIKNQLATEVRLKMAPGDSPVTMLGIELQDGSKDDRLFHVAVNFDTSAADAIFFLNKAIKGVERLANDVLPDRLKKHLVKVATQSGYERFIPSDDHLSGWD